ncbi:MAG: hypothetical protein WAM61_17900, partial [Desulfobacterales bacterium]
MGFRDVGPPLGRLLDPVQARPQGFVDDRLEWQVSFGGYSASPFRYIIIDGKRCSHFGYHSINQSDVKASFSQPNRDPIGGRAVLVACNLREIAYVAGGFKAYFALFRARKCDIPK